MEASALGYVECVRILLEKGAAVSRKEDNSGRTALHLGALSGNLSVMDLLIRHHANPAARDANGAHSQSCLLTNTVWHSDCLQRTLKDSTYKKLVHAFVNDLQRGRLTCMNV